MTIFIISLLIFYLLIPLMINYLVYKSSFLRRLGAIMIAYGIGLIIGNMGMFPQPSKTMVELVNHKEVVLTKELVNKVYPDNEELVIKKMKVNKQLVHDLYEYGTLTEDDVEYFNVFKLQDTLTGLMILLAFPLLLFVHPVISNCPRQAFICIRKISFRKYSGGGSKSIRLLHFYFLIKAGMCNG